MTRKRTWEETKWLILEGVCLAILAGIAASLIFFCINLAMGSNGVLITTSFPW